MGRGSRLIRSPLEIRNIRALAATKAEIQRIREAPKPLKTTGEKASSETFNAVKKLLGALKRRREELGLSQAQLAERLGIESSALCRLETFKVINPTAWTLLQWAEALGCSIDLTLHERKPETAGSVP
jgi:ribosome-binding protein aMBF1 (putative translation factor)